MREPRAKTSALEWLSAAVGLLLLLLVFAVVGNDALRGGDRKPPAIEVTARRVIPSAQGFLVEFDAVNSGGGSAAAVEIEGQLVVSGKPAETATATLDYVAGNARASGGLFFSQDPRQGSMKLRALGYQEP